MAKVGGAVLRVVLAVVLFAHLVTLYLPGSPEPGPDLFPQADKLIHFVAFAVPALLMRLITPRWWPVVLLAVHAPVSELVQHFFLEFRGGDVWDAAADLVGVAAGVFVASKVRARRASVRVESGSRRDEGGLT